MDETNGNGKAIVKYAPQAVSAYEPRNFAEAYEMAKRFAASKLLGELTSPDAAVLVMACGAELGIPATAALRAIYVVKGKPFTSADLMKSLCLRRRDVCEYFRLVSSDEKAATYTAKRAGDEPVTMTFTAEQAKRAKLHKSDGAWEMYPETMLRHRCVAMLAREVFPDLVLGVYCEEERAEIEGERQVIDAQIVDTQAADDLGARIIVFGERIDAATDGAALKAIVADVTADPSCKEIMAQLNDRYTARRNTLQGAA